MDRAHVCHCVMQHLSAQYVFRLKIVKIFVGLVCILNTVAEL